MKCWQLGELCKKKKKSHSTVAMMTGQDFDNWVLSPPSFKPDGDC